MPGGGSLPPCPGGPLPPGGGGGPLPGGPLPPGGGGLLPGGGPLCSTETDTNKARQTNEKYLIVVEARN